MERLQYILIVAILITYVYAEDPKIDTTTGIIKGSRISVQNVDLNVFLGIPFAKPPVGNLRFRRPEPIERWSGIKETKEHVAACIQPVHKKYDHLEGSDIWKIKSNISEDCLYLNIWAPAEARKSRSNLTTMIWIHGGGFTSGSSTLDAYDGRWLAASQNIIVASLNYRVGPFGFLSLNDERAPGNMGLLDQTLAVSWIRDNIVSFGGYRDKLTLFGENAGAISISMHVISPITQKIFRNAIMMSGASNTTWLIKSKKENVDRAKEMAAFLKCPTESDKIMLDCFLKADAKNITLGQFHNFTNFTGIPFSPIIDNYFLQKKPNEVLQYKTVNKDVLIGFVKNEGSLFLLRFPKYFSLNRTAPINKSIAHHLMNETIEPIQANAEQLDSIFYVYGFNFYFSSETEKFRYILGQVAGDTMFKCPVINFSRYMSTHSNVYMYSFEYRSNFTTWPEWMGVIHGSAIFYVFSEALYATTYSSEDKNMSEMMSGYFANFSKSGNPNNGNCSDCSNEQWSKFTPQNQKYFVIDKKPKMATVATSMYSVCNFWSDLLPELKEGSCPALPTSPNHAEPNSGSLKIWTFHRRILTFFTFLSFSLMLFWNFLF